MKKIELIQATTWKFRLFVSDIDDAGVKTVKDLSDYVCFFGLKTLLEDLEYVIGSISGIVDAVGHIDFKIPAETTKDVPPGLYYAEISWEPTSGEDSQKYQYKIMVLKCLLDDVTSNPDEIDSGIANFSGTGETVITHTGDGTKAYNPIASGIGNHNGTIGEITYEIISPTSFKVINTGSSVGQFRWRVYK